jgi:hypothetical protein
VASVYRRREIDPHACRVVRACVYVSVCVCVRARVRVCLLLHTAAMHVKYPARGTARSSARW